MLHVRRKGEDKMSDKGAVLGWLWGAVTASLGWGIAKFPCEAMLVLGIFGLILCLAGIIIWLLHE